MAVDYALVRRLAQARIAKQEALARAAARQLAVLWRRIDPNAIAFSWLSLTNQATSAVAAAQLASAHTADDYVIAALVAQDIDPKTYGHLNPGGFAGVAADGRRLDTLLTQPVIHALTRVKAGSAVADALNVGLLDLTMIVETEIADAGRSSALVSMTARGATGYIRVVQPSACSRCAILAGRWYRYNANFLRHPRCQCTAVPVSEARAAGLITDPESFFGALSEAEQDRRFTRAGAQAIRDGADISRVVNARRSMYTASGRLLTNEARRKLGVRNVRLTPDQIYKEAQGSRSEALRLLKRFGYLT